MMDRPAHSAIVQIAIFLIGKRKTISGNLSVLVMGILVHIPFLVALIF